MQPGDPALAHEEEAALFLPLLPPTSLDGLRAARRVLGEEIARREGHGPPLRHHMMPAPWYAALDAGIRFAVRVLHAAGIETCQSCEGGAGHTYHEPTVDLVADEGAGLRAVAALTGYGLDVLDLAMVWPIADGMPTGRLWRVQLRQAWPDRVDDEPGFVHGYIVTPPRQ